MSSSGGNPFRYILPAGFWARWDNYFKIGGRFQSAAWYYLRDVWARLRRGHISALLGNEDIREHAFADFFQATDHGFAAYEDTTAVPSLVASAHGVVLELGPGTGNQLSRFAAARVAHVYGCEPNTAFAPAFGRRLADTALGQDGKYTLVPCGVEDGEALARFGVVGGSLDCVVSMQCSIPDPAGQVRHMYELLKPGGELIFWEHIRSSDPMTRVVQWLWGLVWPTVFGSCRLDRVTKETLLGTVDWEEVDIEMEMLPHDPMPRLWGRLVKPRAA